MVTASGHMEIVAVDDDELREAHFPPWICRLRTAPVVARHAFRQAKRRKLRPAVWTEEHSFVKDVYRCHDGVLDIGGACLGDVAAKEIASKLSELFTNGLERLHLGGNDMTDEGFAVLCDALVVPCGLKRLNLRCNQLGPLSAEHLAAKLSLLPRLESLDVGHNKLGEEGRITLESAAATLPARRGRQCLKITF
eukprot:TRINITY_DN42145_c0_g1_i1.p1 TRINITY_DN42145_c0_g1~~TRINITY_DN42145_c0_g1_i1.p1  ORF type:complete len:194 (-),score=36.69 TRINITY_DN42145_c0_g1_i1:10-591(-)